MKTKNYIKIFAAAFAALTLILIAVPRVYATESPFVDVAPDFWAYDSIVETYNDGVMMGTGTDANGNRVFSPSDKLNMNQFFTVLTRAFYSNEVLDSKVAGAWPNQNFDVAQKHNLFNGIVSWAGTTEVTREVMAQMMYNVMIDQGIVLPNDSEIQTTMSRIPDFSSVDSNYRTAVAVCYYLDLLSGVNAQGTFAPKGLINRAQTSVIYVRLKKAISTLGTGIPGTPGTTDPGTTTNPGTTAPGTTQNPGETQNPTGATLTNGMPVTEENVLALIEEYRNGKEPGEKAKAAGFTSYTNGSSYDAYTPTYYLDSFGNGKECAKFAFAFWDDIFGTEAPFREVTSPADVRPGDLIQAPGHWSIATSKSYFDEKYGLTRAFGVGGGPTGSIGWSSQAVNISSVIHIYTRYQD